MAMVLLVTRFDPFFCRGTLQDLGARETRLSKTAAKHLWQATFTHRCGICHSIVWVLMPLVSLLKWSQLPFNQ